MNVQAHLSHYKAMKERLLVAFPELAEDESALLDTLEGATDLDTALVALFESAELDKLLAASLKERIGAMQERLARLSDREKRKRTIIAETMESAGLKKIEAASVTLSIRPSPAAVVITDEAAIPAEFWREKITKSPDKTAIKDALAKGEVPGAHLSNGGISLSARTK